MHNNHSKTNTILVSLRNKTYIVYMYKKYLYYRYRYLLHILLKPMQKCK